MTKDQIDYLMTGMIRAAAVEAMWDTWGLELQGKAPFTSKQVGALAVHKQELAVRGVIEGWRKLPQKGD